MSYVFDGITVVNTDGSTFGTVGRSEGPLEEGYFDNTGTWKYEPFPARVSSGQVGIDGSGNVYFDTNGPTFGEGASLFVDPTTFEMWVER